MSELAVLLARVLPNSKVFSSLLKCLLKVSVSSSLLLTVSLILFKIIDSLGKAFSEKRGPTVFKNILLSGTTLWSIFPRKRRWVLLSKLTQKFVWQLECLLDSSFVVSNHRFKITFLSSFVIKLQLFKGIYFIFFWIVLVKNR